MDWPCTRPDFSCRGDFACSAGDLFYARRRVLRCLLFFEEAVDSPFGNPNIVMGALFGGGHAAYGALPLLHGKARKCGVNTRPFLQLDRVIHEKGRLPIVSLLAASPELSFTELRDTLKMTDGNLSRHIKTLQEAGFVSVTKLFQGSRPLTHLRADAGGAEGLSRLH